MKCLDLDVNWPESWQESHRHDRIEFWGDRRALGLTYSYQNRFSRAIRLVQEAVSPSARILDCGAAQGNFSLRLAELGYDVTWNDLRPELADYVKLKQETGVLRFRAGNILDHHVEESVRYDLILATEIVEHVAHPDQFLAKLTRLLKPEGKIVLTTPNGEYFLSRYPKFSECADSSVYESRQFQPDSDGHIFLLWVDELPELARKSGLEIEEVAVFNNPLTSGHWKLRFLLPFLPKWFVRMCESCTQKLPGPLMRKLNAHIACRLRVCAATSDRAEEGKAA